MSRVVDAVFKITDQFSTPLQNFNTALTDVGRQGRRARKQIADVGNSIAGFGTALTAGVTTPLVGLATSSYSTFEGVDKQLALVEATMGSTAYATADLSKALSDAAVNSIFSMEEGASALVNYARQGWDAAQSASMLAPALNLAAGTATDLDSVTSGLGNTLKAFGADSSEATKYVDMFTQAQAQANTDVQGLFDAMSIAGPIAKTVGWSFEDIATLTGVFGDASISASEGANALKTGLARLASPAKQGAEAMKQLGINIFDEQGAMLAMPEVIGELQKGFEGLSEQEALSAASAIFGKNQMSKWLALINGPGTSSLQEMRDQISDASGNAQIAADALVTPTERLKSTFDVFKVSVGSIVADVAVPLINKATELIDKFRQMDPALQKNIVKFAGIAAAAGPAILIFGKTVVGASKLMGVFAGIHKYGNLAKAGIAAVTSPAGLVIAGIAGIVAVAAVLITHFDEIKESAQTSLSQAQPYIEKFQTAWEKLKGVLEPLKDFMVGAFTEGVLAAFKGFAEGGAIWVMVDGFTKVISGFADILEGLGTFLTGAFTEDWDTAWSGLKQTFTGVFESMTGLVEGFLGLLGGIGDAVSGAKTAVSTFVEEHNPFAKDKTKGNASGTSYWQGGPTRVNESGGEIINLPSGTQIIPHDASQNTKTGGSNITISKLADQIVVREDADIDKIADKLARKLMKVADNMGSVSMA